MPIGLTKLMSKKKDNYNSLVIGSGLFIKKNKSYLLFFYSKILHMSILSPISLVIARKVHHYYYSCTYSDIIFYTSILALFGVEVFIFYMNYYK